MYYMNTKLTELLFKSLYWHHNHRKITQHKSTEDANPEHNFTPSKEMLQKHFTQCQDIHIELQ